MFEKQNRVSIEGGLNFDFPHMTLVRQCRDAPQLIEEATLELEKIRISDALLKKINTIRR